MGLRQGPGSHHLTSPAGPIFDAYHAVRHRLPAPTAGGACTHADTLGDIAHLYDTFLLDAFGVLNVGETAIPGAVERIRDLRDAGKRLMIVSNAAGLPHETLMAKYDRMGFGFAPGDVITSRMALFAGLADAPANWAAMATTGEGLPPLTLLRDDPAEYDAAEGFLLIGSAEWTDARQSLLEASLRADPRPVHVGNPDIAAPREDAPSREPGHWAHRLADATGIEPRVPRQALRRDLRPRLRPPGATRRPHRHGRRQPAHRHPRRSGRGRRLRADHRARHPARARRGGRHRDLRHPPGPHPPHDLSQTTASTTTIASA